MEIWDILGKKSAVDVLLTVYNNPGLFQTQIADKSKKSSGSRLDRLKELTDAGLIREEKSSKHWSALTYYITDEGARICKHLIAIQNPSSPDMLEELPSQGEKV